jgi:choline dehydrogenase-like flavoprotein
MIPRWYIGGSGPPPASFEYDWHIKTAPQIGLGNRSISLTQGKLIGGGSALNAMVYDRGRAADYDSWADMGSPGWDFASLLPYFKKVRGTTQSSGKPGAETDRPRLSHLHLGNNSTSLGSHMTLNVTARAGRCSRAIVLMCIPSTVSPVHTPGRPNLSANGSLTFL